MPDIGWFGLLVMGVSGLVTLLILVTLVVYVVRRFRATQPQRKRR